LKKILGLPSSNPVLLGKLTSLGLDFLYLRPLVCSDSLREALGLRSYQLPPYIYRMRTMGYPPGHLADAKKEESGLTVFDSSGKGLYKLHNHLL
jgi:hypothetical protein